MNILNKNDIKHKTKKRKLIERSIIFSITAFGFLFFLTFDLFFSYAYKIDGFNDLQWVAYWTHLSNIGALIWITLAFIAVTNNNEKIEKWIQHWNIKNTVFTFILVTGLVFMFVAYVPTVKTYSQKGDIPEIQELVLRMAWSPYNAIISPIKNGLPIKPPSDLTGIHDIAKGTYTANNLVTHSSYIIQTDPSVLYRIMVIVGTTFKHLIIPGMFLYLAITEVGYYRTRQLTDYQRSMIQFIWPCLYIVYSVTLCSAYLISPPYPVLDFGFTYSFYSMSDKLQIIWIITALILDMIVGIMFVLITFAQNRWTHYILEDKKN